MSLPIPPEFEKGYAKEGGDCFFDSFAQCLRNLRPRRKYSIQSLRRNCSEYCHQMRNKEWFQERILRSTGKESRVYTEQIQYWEATFSQNIHPNGIEEPVRGGPVFEGGILCQVCKVRLHLIKKCDNEDRWTNEIIDEKGSQSVDDVDFGRNNTIHIVQIGETHFEPILKTTCETAKRRNSDLHNAAHQSFKKFKEVDFTNPEISDVHSMEVDKLVPSISGIQLPLIGNNESLNEVGEDNSFVGSKPLRYPRRPGTNPEHGVLYEVNFLILLLVRVSMKTDNFQIATNVDELGAFDDIVVKYYNAKERKLKTVFMQLKHKLNINDEGKYSLANNKFKNLLKELLKSYIDIKNKFSYINDNIFKGDFADCEFILYTNNLLASAFENNTSDFNKTEMGQMFRTKGHIVQLCKNPEVHELLALKFPNTNATQVVHEFLNNFHLFVGQADKTEIGNIIKQEIQSSFEVDQAISDIAYKSLLDEGLIRRGIWGICEAYTESTAGHLIINWILRSIREPEIEAIYDDIKIADRKSSQLAELVKTHSVVNIVHNQNQFKLLSIRGIRELMQNFPDMKPLFLELKQFIQYKSFMLQAFEMRKLLVIEGKWSNQFSDELNHISRTIERNANLHFIVITDNTGRVALKECFNDLIECDKFTFHDMDSETKKTLGQKELTFQGKRITLCQLIDASDKEAADVIDSETIMKLVNDSLVICKEPQGLRGLEANYGKMYAEVSLENLVDASKTFQDKSIFLIFGIAEDSLKSGGCRTDDINEMLRKGIIKVFPTAHNHHDMLDTFKEKCVDETLRIVYLIEYKDRKFTLHHLYDPNSYVKRNFCHPGKCRIRTDILFQETQSDTFILESNSDKIDLEKWGQDWKENCLQKFEQKCDSEKIIFEPSEDKAQSVFNDLTNQNNSVIWLSLRFGKFIVKDCNDTRLTLNVEDKLDEGFIFNVMRCYATCIIGESDGTKVKELLIEYTEKKLRFFNSNCKNKKIAIKTEKETEGLEFTERNKEMHRLKIDDNDFENLVWLHSNGSFNVLNSYVSTSDDECLVNNFDGQCVILADEPGMGKSTTLTSLAGQMFHKYWVIRVDFRECEKSIKYLPSNSEKQLTFEDVVDFFSKIANTGMQSKLSKDIFLHKLQQEMPQNIEIMILMDAYDEIKDELQQKVIFLIKFLKDKKSAKVWVTTRLTKVQELEKALATFATRFEAFDIIHQEKFLHKFWFVRLNLLVGSESLNRLKQYSNQLLEKSRKLLGQGIFQLMGIPLQLRLLAEGFKNEALQFCQNSNESLDLKGLNLINMYRQFIDDRFNLHFTYKVRVEGLDEGWIDAMKNTGNENYRNLAVKLLFPGEDELLTNYKPPTEKEESAIKSVGIIQSFGSEGNTYFIHRTFAEYFAADFLSLNLCRQTIIQFLMKEIFKPSNIVISHFLDQMLSENSINMTVLEGDLSKLLECLKENEGEQFTDRLGRTALHLAARYRHEVIVKVLLDSGYDAFKQDVFGKTCLHYATMNGHKSIVKHLLDYTSDIDIKSALPDEDDLLMCDPSRKCIFLNSEHLSSNIVKFVNEKDFNGASSLRASLDKQDWRISRLLIKFGAEVSCVNEEERNSILDTQTGLAGFSKVLLFLTRNNGQPELVDSDEDEDTQKQLSTAARRHDLEEVKKLVSNGAEVNMINKYGATALDSAIPGIYYDSNRIHEIANTVKYLLIDCKGESKLTDAERRIATEIMRTRDHTLLHEATTLPTTFFAAYLIHLGADVNLRDQDGRTPLHRAVLHLVKLNELLRKNEMILFLLKNGAKHHAKDIYNKTVFHYILHMENTEDFRLLIDIEKAATTKKYRKLLSRFNTDDGIYQINEEDNQGNALLHCAASTGSTEGVIHLLKYGAHFNATSRKKETAKQIAENTNQEEIMEKLQTIQNIFDVVAANNTEDIKTFLDAVKSKQSDDFFLTVINSHDNEGNTPLHLAAKANNFQIVHFLLTVGACYDALNNKEKTFDDVTTDQQIWELFEVVHSILDVHGKINYNPVNEKMNPLVLLNARKEKWETFLHKATSWYNYRNYYRINYFIKNGADINAIDKDGRTALEHALTHNLDFVKLLLTNGVNISNLTSDKLKQLKDNAKSKGREDILAMLP